MTLSDTQELSDQNTAENKTAEIGSSETETTEVALERDPFYTDIPDLIAQSELNLGFRHTRKGIFVSEECEHHLIDAYQRWLHQQTGKSTTRNEEKCRKRLYGSDDSKLYYLLDGKRCLAGHLLRGNAGEPRTPKKGKNAIPAYQGELLDPLSFLHPNDPFLKKLESVEYKFLPTEGSLLFFSNKKAQVKVSFDRLQQFAELARSSKEIRKKYPSIEGSLRGCIHPLQQLLSSAKPKKGKQSTLLPNAFEKLTPSLALTQGAITFLLNKESHLLASYIAKGPSFKKLILEDIVQLATKHPLTSVKGFTLLSGKQKSLGKVRIKNTSYQLEPSIFFHFVRLILRSKSRNPLPRFLTARDVMLRLVSALKAARVPSDTDERELTGGRRISGRSYLVSGKWVFVVSDKTRIAACFVRKGNQETPAASRQTKPSPQRSGDEKSNKKRRRRRRRKPKPQSE